VVESLAARVQVVGTRFRVDVDGLGNTQVSVREGVVEVVPRSGAVRRVAAGQNTYVRADEGDDYERAVRAAIERNLGAQGSREPAVAKEREAEATPPADVDAVPNGQRAKAIARKLENARRLLRRGQHAAARAQLRGLTEPPTALRFRVEAWTLTAESYTAQGDIPKASQAYRRADEIAPTSASGNNARFALARLLERYAHDRDAAAAAYHRYLERAPQGALGSQAKQALCRLGETEYCE
jgi:tetratricopeptide (TPR) repeat protein